MMIWAMRHRLAEPCHDRKLHSTDFIYSFDVGKTNQLLRKQNSDTEPQSHNAYSIVLSSVLFIVILPVHSMYWPTRLQRLMLQICSFWQVRVRYRVTVYTQPTDGVMGLHTWLFVSAETYEVYISFTLFIHVIALWYIHWCTVCASILIQGWHRYTEAWPSEVGSLHEPSILCHHRRQYCDIVECHRHPHLWRHHQWLMEPLPHPVRYHPARQPTLIG